MFAASRDSRRLLRDRHSILFFFFGGISGRSQSPSVLLRPDISSTGMNGHECRQKRIQRRVLQARAYKGSKAIEKDEEYCYEREGGTEELHR